MKLSYRTSNNICIIDFAERLTLTETLEMEISLTALSNMDFEGYVLDFTKVQRIDSSGIGLVIAFFNRLRKREIKAVLCPNEYLTSLFRKANLSDVIPTYSTEEEAVSSFQN
ncbi:MAG: STAS domain-containing protein [SAR324 cluster bacterium]|nr:STAS domain-containing protein [SAR324 cluster bacterium]